jgi:hypothetical protein
MMNPHAQALGKLGGEATARKPLTKAQLEARRKNAAIARSKRFPQKSEISTGKTS